MPSRDQFPIVEHGRKHTATASIVGRRVLDFGGEIIAPARYVFSQATITRVTRGAQVTYSSRTPTKLPVTRPGFNRTYYREIDQNLFSVEHSFSGTETLMTTSVESGLIVMRNEEGLGRAELTVKTQGGRRSASLRQAMSRAAIEKAAAKDLPGTTAAAVIRALVQQHGSYSKGKLQTLETLDDLFMALNDISPAVKIEREGVYETTREGTFNFSSLRVSEDVRQRQGKPAVTVNQAVTCTGMQCYDDFPGIVGTVSMSLATGPKTADTVAFMQASIDIPEGQEVSKVDRNHILAQTMLPYQTLDGFMALFDRQLDSI